MPRGEGRVKRKATTRKGSKVGTAPRRAGAAGRMTGGPAKAGAVRRRAGSAVSGRPGGRMVGGPARAGAVRRSPRKPAPSAMRRPTAARSGKRR